MSVCTCCLVNEYQDCNAHLGVGICHSEVPCHTCDQLLGIQNFDPNKWGLENGLTTQNWGLESIGTMVDYGAPVSGGPSFSATNGVPIDPPILLGTENHPPSILWDHFVPICTILLSIFPRVYEYDWICIKLCLSMQLCVCVYVSIHLLCVRVHCVCKYIHN